MEHRVVGFAGFRHTDKRKPPKENAGRSWGGRGGADEADIRILKLSKVNARHPVRCKKKNRTFCEFHETRGGGAAEARGGARWEGTGKAQIPTAQIPRNVQTLSSRPEGRHERVVARCCWFVSLFLRLAA